MHCIASFNDQTLSVFVEKKNFKRCKGAVGPDLAKFTQFGEILKSLLTILEGIFSILNYFQPTLATFLLLGNFLLF